MKSAKKPPRKARSFRISPELLDKARAQGIDVTKLFEMALAEAVGAHRCPVCGSKLKK